MENAISLAEDFEADLRQRANWEVITSASLAVLTFRLNPRHKQLDPQQLDHLNQSVSERIIADGRAMLATTIVNGRTVLRMCLINPRTTIEDLLSTVESLEGYADQAGVELAP